MDYLFGKNLVLSARPKQWLKNIALFAALVFSGQLFEPLAFSRTLVATLIFSLLVSSVYFLNDIIDLPRDKLHPIKKQRPIAKGDLPLPLAFFFSITGILTSLYLAIWLSSFFFFTCLLYFLLQIIYSLCLKNFTIFDVLAIAGSFVLRVYAGAFVINAHLSVWFLLCVISLALFLSVGKRRAELNILAETAGQHRRTLALYSKELLDQYLAIFASSTWLSWSLFTFFEPPPVVHQLRFLTLFPLTLAGINKWLMITIPIVIYGIMRYLRIIQTGAKAESPEKVLLSDKPLLASAILWGLLIVGIIYGGAP